MKKCLLTLITGLTLLCMTGFAQATLVTIGTAEYNSSTYNLIYDDDDTGYNGGGLVWLDYTNGHTNWQTHTNWTLGLGTALSVTLNPGYTTSIDWTTGWRLPDAVDGPVGIGYDEYKGDPNSDGIYDYAEGYNLANSEIGHLFYTELGNLGYYDVFGSSQYPVGLENTGDFDNLLRATYWSGTNCVISGLTNQAWVFNLSNGHQYDWHRTATDKVGIAVHSGEVSFNESAPVPEPATMFLFGTGLIGLASTVKRKLKK